MKRYIILVLVFLSLPLFSNKSFKNIDYLGVAGVLIRDGNYERAEDTLDNIDLETKGLDLERYYILKGLVDLRLGRYEDSLMNFNKAINNESDPIIYAYIAQSYFSLEDYHNCIQAVEKVPNTRVLPDLYGLKSQALWFVDKKDEAFDFLEDGIKVFPGKVNFRQQKVVYLIELNLAQSALESSKALIEMKKDDPEIYLTLAESFRKAGDSKRASLIVEEAKLKFPDNQRVMLMLAQCYIDLEQYLTSAKLLEELSIQNSKYIKDGADLYIKANSIHKAAYLNSQLSDIEIKSRIRFNLLLTLNRFEEAVALIPRLERMGLLSDQSLVYAVAYVYFRIQDYDKAKSYLNKISDDHLFREATKLRKAIRVMEEEAIPLF